MSYCISGYIGLEDLALVTHWKKKSKFGVFWFFVFFFPESLIELKDNLGSRR